MIQMLCTVLGGAANKHQALVSPAILFCLDIWDKASSHMQSASTDAHHARSRCLVYLLLLVRYRWRALVGVPTRLRLTAAAGDTGSAQHPLAATLRQAAGQSSSLQGGGSAEGAAAVARVVDLLLSYVAAAASQHMVLPAADVRLVLEEVRGREGAAVGLNTNILRAALLGIMACVCEAGSSWMQWPTSCLRGACHYAP